MSKIQSTIGYRILILSEGEKTEINYFNSFKRNDKYKRNLSGVDIICIHPKDHSPLGLVKEAKKRIQETHSKDKDKYDLIWILFDKDGHTGIPNAFEEVRNHNLKNPKNKICIGFSNICIEYWILLHFEKTAKPFIKCDEVIHYIKEKNYIPNYDKGKFKYETLIEKDFIEEAIQNAKWLINQMKDEILKNPIYEINPLTTIHKLVEIIYQLADTGKSDLIQPDCIDILN